MMKRSVFRRRRSQASCHEVGRALQGYLDGEVEEDFAVKIAEHLEDCRRCGLEAETYTRIKKSLAGRRPQVDEAAVARLRAFGDQLTSESG